MKLIVGLGNPGEEYRLTRHNVGFLALDLYLQRIGKRATLKTDQALAVSVQTEAGECWFLKPQTFMNNSGGSVASFARKKSIPPEETLILHDEADLEHGRLQLKKGGGSGGHNGLESVFAQWGEKEFWRLRIGVGKDPYKDLADYVLEPVKEGELLPLAEKAADAMAEVLKSGPAQAMNLLNRALVI